MKKYIVLLALVLFPALAFADSTSVHQGVKVHHGTTSTGHPYFKATETAQGQGTVLSVNKKTRVVKILGEQGDTVAVTCGPEIKNFAKIAKGDVVKVKYTETLTIHVEPEGTPPNASAETSLVLGEAGREALRHPDRQGDLLRNHHRDRHDEGHGDGQGSRGQ